jgi:DNA topoisomerase-1
MQRFWEPFKALVDEKTGSVDRSDATGARDLGVDPKSGKPVSVRLGRYGAFAQIGRKEDDDKPKFASLRPGQSMHTIGLDDALQLFLLPRTLGEDEGEPVTVAVGRFGPFAKRGATYASLGKEDDPYTIDFARALSLVREREAFLANRLIKKFDGSPIEILNGRYGPYLTDGEKNGKIPKDREPASLTQEECEEILVNAPARPTRGRFARKGGSKAPAKKATTKSAPAKTAEPASAAKKTAAKKTAVRKSAAKKIAK